MKSSSAQTEIWKPVDMTDLARLEDRIGNARKIKIPFVYDVSFGIVCTFVSFFLLFPISFNFGKYGLFTLINLYFIFFPFFWFAKVVKWYPKKLARKLNAFGPLLAAELPENIHFAPMLCFDGEKAEVTKDIRLMLAPGANTPESVRDELAGVQFQVTYNRGPNGEVPYMYAVFITKGTEKLWEYLKAVRCPGYVIEAGSSREGGEVYGTVVLRQDTQSRADGFHTRERDIEELLHLVIEILKKAGGGS